MKNTFLLAFAILSVGLALQSFSLSSGIADPVGTWTYSAPTAPEGYEKGDIVIAKEKEAYSASLKFGDYVIKGTSVKYEKDILTFKVFLEGEYISVKAVFTADSVKGTASYSEGDIEFTASKKVSKK